MSESGPLRLRYAKGLLSSIFALPNTQLGTYNTQPTDCLGTMLSLLQPRSSQKPTKLLRVKLIIPIIKINKIMHDQNVHKSFRNKLNPALNFNRPFYFFSILTWRMNINMRRHRNNLSRAFDWFWSHMALSLWLVLYICRLCWVCTETGLVYCKLKIHADFIFAIKLETFFDTIFNDERIVYKHASIIYGLAHALEYCVKSTYQLGTSKKKQEPYKLLNQSFVTFALHL